MSGCRQGTREGFDYSHPLPVVPDLCAEVLLDSLATHDVDRRVNAYLAGGAWEVIVVDRYGRVYFWGDKGPRQTSRYRARARPGVLHKQLSCEWSWAFVSRVV
ncbi:hypothetical protein PTKU46_93550 [Paraburkholderia terrae]